MTKPRQADELQYRLREGPCVGAASGAEWYARHEGRFGDRDELDVAVLYGARVAIALTSAREISGLRTAMASRHAIGLAHGNLMEGYGLSIDSAFTLLRRCSSELTIKLADIAADIAATRQPPSDDARGQPPRRMAPAVHDRRRVVISRR